MSPPEAAFRDYGVVCDATTLEIDVKATERIRAAKATLAQAGDP